METNVIVTFTYNGPVTELLAITQSARLMGDEPFGILKRIELNRVPISTHGRTRTMWLADKLFGTPSAEIIRRYDERQ